MKIAALAARVAAAESARDAGRLDEALAGAEAAWRETPADAGPLRRRLGLLLLHLRYRTGALAAVVDLADQLLPLLRAGGPTTELIDSLRLTALCAADAGRFTTSLGCAQEAHRLALELDDAVRLALTCNAMACFFERSGDPWQAERLMLESLTMARRTGDAHAVRVCLNNTGAALIGRYYLQRDALPPDEAADCLLRARPFVEESVAMAHHSGEPFFQVFASGNLGEILVHLGDADGAGRLLEEALALARPRGFAAQVCRLECSLGELALLQQQPGVAWDRLHAVLASPRCADLPTVCMRLHHALWRAAVALDRTADALHHLQAYLVLERQRSVLQLRAQSELFVTRMEAEQVRQEAQRQRARATALEADVRRDPLTGLGNRRELEARWPALIARAQGSGATPLSVAMIDIDHFKQVNDTHGHAMGDQVLAALATLLQAHAREADMLARLGGEEFLLVLPDTAGPEAAALCERLRLQVARHDWSSLAPGLRVTLSIGLTSAPPADAQALSLRADAALYRAKAGGRNRLVQA